jgi:hypothetical protein
LERSADPRFDLVNRFILASRNARRLERDAGSTDIDAPALLAKICDEKADGPELIAVTVVDIPTSQGPEFAGEGRQNTRLRTED